jgi:hypothetical protein
VSSLQRDITGRQTDVEKGRDKNGKAQELLEGERSKQRKLEDALFDKETTVKVMDNDYQARRTDLELVLKSTSHGEESRTTLM